MNQAVIERTRAFSKNACAFDNSHMLALRCADGGLHIVKCEPQPELVGTTMTRAEWNTFPIRKLMGPDIKPLRTILQAQMLEEELCHMKDT